MSDGDGLKRIFLTGDEFVAVDCGAKTAVLVEQGPFIPVFSLGQIVLLKECDRGDETGLLRKITHIERGSCVPQGVVLLSLAVYFGSPTSEAPAGP